MVCAWGYRKRRVNRRDRFRDNQTQRQWENGKDLENRRKVEYNSTSQILRFVILSLMLTETEYLREGIEMRETNRGERVGERKRKGERQMVERVNG